MVIFNHKSRLTDGFMYLSEMDCISIVRRIPKELLPVIADHGAFIAGGFIRSVICREEIQDLDLFARDKDTAKMIAVLSSGNKYHESDNAYTFKVDGLTVQVIHRWSFDEPVDCIKSFDFTIACAAIILEKQTPFQYAVWSICDVAFYRDLAAKRLVYRSPIRAEEAGGSLLRVLKFYQRGYRIPLASLAAVISRLMGGVTAERLKTEPGTPEREQELSEVLAGLLYEVDPLNVDWRSEN